MFQGDHDGAEMYLQMAARWAPSPSDQISSLINLGASKLAQSYPAPYFDTSGRVQSLFLQSLALHTSPGDRDRDGDDALKVAGADKVHKGVTGGLDDAVGYLEEAMGIALSTGPAEVHPTALQYKDTPCSYNLVHSPLLSPVVFACAADSIEHVWARAGGRRGEPRASGNSWPRRLRPHRQIRLSPCVIVTTCLCCTHSGGITGAATSNCECALAPTSSFTPVC